MQVIVNQIVSQIRAFDSDLSPQTLERVVAAALEAVRAEAEHQERVAEEGSLHNFQQRNRPWMA